MRNRIIVHERSSQFRCAKRRKLRYSKIDMVAARAAVALTQISAYNTHKNSAVRKIMDTMRTVHAKSGRDFNTPQTAHQANDHGRHAYIVKGKRASFAKSILFRWIVCGTRWWRCFWNASFVSLLVLCGGHRIFEFLYANFLSTCVRCTHLLKS